MHKDPARRYASVEALMRDVDHYLSGEPLEARPDTMRYRAGKFVRRNWRAVTMASVTFAMLIALTVFYTLGLAGARNVALAETARTQRIQRFMLDLFQGNEDEAVGPADSLRVVTLVDRGAQQLRSLDLEPGVQAELYETLGSLYRTLGKLSPADSLLRTALARRRAIYGPSNPEVVSSMLALGELRIAQAEYDSAEVLIRDALALATRTMPPTDARIGKATTDLGQLLYERGDYAKAVPVLEQAVRLQMRGDTATPALASAVTDLANTYFYLGKYAVSDSLNQRALAMDKHLYGPNHAFVADVLINLGAIRFEWAKYPEAERYYRDALVVNQAWYGPNHPETASNLTALGRALASEQKLVEADTVLSRALAVLERVYGPVHPRVASALNEYSRVKQAEGHLDEAEAGFRRMADIYKTIYHDKHYVISIALSNIAGVLQERKQYAQAEALFREAVQRYDGLLAPDHQLVGIARARLGKSIRLQGRFPEALKETLAGYEILMKQAPPSVTWVQRTASDLAAEYDSLGRPAEAAKVRADSAALGKK
jgi:serine/threonine-protein kinase